MRFLSILYLLLVLVVNSRATNLEYPSNLDEFRHIEEAARVDEEDVSASDRINIVQTKLGTKLLDLIGEELDLADEVVSSRLKDEGAYAKAVEVHKRAQHLRALYQQYTSIANVNADKCDESQVDDLVFLINFHSKLDGSADLMNYLKHFTIRQIEVCKPLWDAKLKELLNGVDKFTKSHMASLIDHMILNMFRLAHRPYQRQNLLAIANRPPFGGIQSFLSKLVEMNLNGCNWKDFLQSADLTLVPLCRKVCDKFKEPFERYRFLFDQNLADNLKVRDMIHNETNSFWEWIASTKICCRLTADRDRLSIDVAAEDSTNTLVTIYHKNFHE